MSAFKTLGFILHHPLNATGRWRSLMRFVRWQIVSRLAPSKTAIPFVDGSFLFMKRGMTGATGNWYCGLHEPDEMGFTLHYLRSSDLFLDVGANVGSYTILAAGGVGARVVSVEPIPDTFRSLEDNVRLNRLDALVDCHCIGIADRPGVLRFSSTDDTMNRIVEADGEGVISVEVETVDGLLEGNCPMLMKIDVEGHEHKVLAGAASTLRDPRLGAVLMETNGLSDNLGHTKERLTDIMRGLGFTLCHYDAVRRELMPGQRGNNSIFVRDVESARARCRDARRYMLVNVTI